VFETAMAPDYGAGVDYAHPPTSASPALPLAAYLGSYRNDLFAKIEIVAFESGLALKLGPKLVAFPMQHFDRDAFAYQPSEENAYGRSAVAFSIGASRKATAVTIEDLNTDGQGIFRRA
jgi:hypothetical protein